MRTAIIIRFDGLGRESVAFFTDPQAAKLAFKSASFTDGGLELWTSSKGRIKRRRFTGGKAEEVPLPVEPEPTPEPEPAPVDPVAAPEPEPAVIKPQTTRKGWRR